MTATWVCLRHEARNAVLRSMIAAAFLVAVGAYAPPAAADDYVQFIDVRCEPEAQVFSVREGGTWAYDAPFANGLIPIDRNSHGPMHPDTTAPSEGDLMARCRFDRGEPSPLLFEVRRIGFRPPNERLCGGSWADFVITLNDKVIANWPSGYMQCVSPRNYPPPLGRSVTFDAARVEICGATAVRGELLGRRTTTIQCRAEDLGAVLRAEGWPPE